VKVHFNKPDVDLGLTGLIQGLGGGEDDLKPQH